jgi:hypothetical protein
LIAPLHPAICPLNESGLFFALKREIERVMFEELRDPGLCNNRLTERQSDG